MAPSTILEKHACKVHLCFFLQMNVVYTKVLITLDLKNKQTNKNPPDSNHSQVNTVNLLMEHLLPSPHWLSSALTAFSTSPWQKQLGTHPLQQNPSPWLKELTLSSNSAPFLLDTEKSWLLSHAPHWLFDLPFTPFGGRTSTPVSYTHLTLPTNWWECRSRWSPYH